MVEHCSTLGTRCPASKKKGFKRHGNPIGGKRHINSITYPGVEAIFVLGWFMRNNEVLFTRGFVAGLLRASFEAGGKDSLVGVDSLIS